MQDNDNTDDLFAAITAGVELAPAVADVIVPMLNDEDLTDEYARVRAELVARGELVTQTTAEGRDLEATRKACIYQFDVRGLRA